MRTQFAIDYYGGRTGLAKALGIDRTAICHWGEEVPELRQYQLQVLTKGALVAEKNTATQEDADRQSGCDCRSETTGLGGA